MRIMHRFQTELVSVRMKRTKESVNMEQKQIEYSEITDQAAMHELMKILNV